MEKVTYEKLAAIVDVTEEDLRDQVLESPLVRDEPNLAQLAAQARAHLLELHVGLIDKGRETAESE